MMKFYYYRDAVWTRIRRFLCDSHRPDERMQSFHMGRLNFSLGFSQTLCESSGIWRMSTGYWADEQDRIVAVVLNDAELRGEAYFHFLEPEKEPGGELLSDMFAFFETHTFPGARGGKRHVFISRAMPSVERAAINRGYAPTGEVERYCMLSVEDRAYEVSLPEGFSFGSGESVPDAERALCHMHGLGYAPPAKAEQAFCALRAMPDYLPALDLCVYDAAGRVAAYAHFWYDEQNQLGMIEPLTTVPWHRCKGLGRALVFEGINRMRAMGGLSGLLGGDQPFFQKLGFLKVAESRAWAREE